MLQGPIIRLNSRRSPWLPRLYRTLMRPAAVAAAEDLRPPPNPSHPYHYRLNQGRLLCHRQCRLVPLPPRRRLQQLRTQGRLPPPPQKYRPVRRSWTLGTTRSWPSRTAPALWRAACWRKPPRRRQYLAARAPPTFRRASLIPPRRQAGLPASCPTRAPTSIEMQLGPGPGQSLRRLQPPSSQSSRPSSRKARRRRPPSRSPRLPYRRSRRQRRHPPRQ